MCVTIGFVTMSQQTPPWADENRLSGEAGIHKNVLRGCDGKVVRKGGCIERVYVAYRWSPSAQVSGTETSSPSLPSLSV